MLYCVIIIAVTDKYELFIRHVHLSRCNTILKTNLLAAHYRQLNGLLCCCFWYFFSYPVRMAKLIKRNIDLWIPHTIIQRLFNLFRHKIVGVKLHSLTCTLRTTMTTLQCFLTSMIKKKNHILCHFWTTQREKLNNFHKSVPQRFLLIERTSYYISGSHFSTCHTLDLDIQF